MRYAHIIDAVMAQPWLIRAESHRAIRWALDKKLNQSLDSANSDLLQRIQDWEGQAKAVERKGIDGFKIQSAEVIRGTCFIPVVGILARRVSRIEKSLCGMCDYDDIIKDLHEAREDESVERVVLDIDSPGGMVNGCYEVCDAVAALAKEKPVMAFTAGQMCSGAYYLACGATAIAATSSAIVGSVGVILQVLDDSEAHRMAGLKVETFRSDELKAVGSPGETLSDIQREYLTGIVTETADRFKETVMHNRQLVKGEDLDGRVYSADKAKSVGLIDRVVGSIHDAVDIIR